MKRVAVTGAGGFLGRALTKSLAKTCQVVAIDNNYRGNLNSLALEENILSQCGDVLDPQEMLRLLDGCDAVFHLAAINGTENFYKVPGKVLEVGIIGTHNVIKAALHHKIKRFYFTSTSEVYNLPTEIPTPESVECKVTDVFNKRFSYAGGKIAGELMVINYLRDTDVQYIIFRPHNVYGPQMGFEHVIPQLTAKVFEAARTSQSGERKIPITIQGEGTETRAFMYIDDAIRAIETCVTQEWKWPLVHLGVTEETSIADLSRLIGSTAGYDLELRHAPRLGGSPDRRCPDTTRIRSLGFTPSVSLAEGVRRTVDWYWKYFQEHR